jgi:Fe-S-cluster-containing dehydrogenase component/DMSO reductase anchor subunit
MSLPEETAVETFARRHETLAEPRHQEVERYRALLPLAAPRPGQQLAFEVDLDACTGCKACVTGCHNLNGLDSGELWRTVGLLQGGSAQSPVAKIVTTACHHCIEPACMIGCPVKAYDKDPITGIVKHLDDQCIGCQYCIFMCPYDAPKFNTARGIVRKCDLCADRLAHEEAPACVQSCPNEAIRITVVERSHAVEATSFLPGAPAPDDTLPTTVYRTRGELPRNLLPADFYSLHPERAHPPLAVMLVLTQLSAGAFALERALGASVVHGRMALFLCLVALGASTLHLGRPRFAFRAILGLGTSWLSREIVLFSLFAALAALWAIHPARWLLDCVAAAGVSGVIASVMVYEATRRPAWRWYRVGPLFLFSAALLGCALRLALGDSSLASLTVALLGVKLLGESSLFAQLRTRRHTALKRRALLLRHQLKRETVARYACGMGGLLILVVPWIGFLFIVAGELLERHLFFAAAPAPHMPGSL